MGRTGTRYWIYFLGTLSLGLLLAALSPGSLPAEKAMDLTGLVMRVPEWPARTVRNVVVQAIDLAAGERVLRERIDRLEEERFSQVYLQQQGTVDVDDGRGGKRPALSFSISLTGGIE